MSHVPNERVYCCNCEALREQNIHGRCANCDSDSVVSEHAQHMWRERAEQADYMDTAQAEVKELERMLGRKS